MWSPAGRLAGVAHGLQRRLVAPGRAAPCVQREIGRALNRAPAGPLGVLGLLPHHRRRGDMQARLVELDPRNAERAAATARDAGRDRVEVVVADTSTTTAYQGAVPADLVLVCGAFGHAGDDDIRRTVAHLPILCAPVRR